MANEDLRLWYCSKCDIFHKMSEKCPKTDKSYTKKEEGSEKQIETKILEELLERKQELLNKKEKLLGELKEKIEKREQTQFFSQVKNSSTLI